MTLKVSWTEERAICDLCFYKNDIVSNKAANILLDVNNFQN